ncbi:hypothetical protein SDC9_04067 [bioreactor metagenome]|uniref:Uncharacterized protein n=1 Tax=bioreactor metagenome TaxID=1076179 RepID=A0A644SV92_9ZZZZ
MNIGHCPETSKDANGLNRYYRIKVLLNVAENSLRHIVLKLNEEGRSNVLIVRPSVFRGLMFLFLGFFRRRWFGGFRTLS